MSDNKVRRASREPGVNETAAGGPAAERTVETTETAMAQALAVPDLASPEPPREEAAGVSAEPASVAGPERQEPDLERFAACADDTWAAFSEAQLALVRGFGEIAAEWAGIAQSGITAGADAAIALIGAKTIVEAFEIQAGLARRNFGAAVEGSAKLSEIGIKAADEAYRPLLSQLSRMPAGFAGA